MTRMFDNKFDPLQELQRLRDRQDLQQHHLEELSKYTEELARSHNAQAKLIKQITEQNTELLSLWAFNQPLNK